MPKEQKLTNATLPDNLPNDPYDLFKEWLEEAKKSEPNDYNAMCLATASKDAIPSARMLLLKGLSKEGFVFYTNSQSRKGEETRENENAALCFYWKSLRKQVRIEGIIEEVTDSESDEYYKTRDRNSRIGAWASQQSKPLTSYNDLIELSQKHEDDFEGKEDIPRPPHWKGFRVKPKSIEFWINGAHRLHQRYLYTQDSNGNWTIGMLYP